MSAETRLLSPVLTAAITDAMLEGLGLFDAAERFGVSPVSIVASCEDRLTRKYLKGLSKAVEEHRVKRVQVPKWVPVHLRSEYENIAAKSGEEEAASCIRRRKREEA